MTSAKTREKSKSVYVPIYDIRFEIVICDSIPKAHNKRVRVKRLGGEVEKETYAGLCSYCRGNCSIFFKRQELSHALIAHEVFHATQWFCLANNIPFGSEVDKETCAILCEGLTKIVYETLRKWKIRIK